MDDAVAVALELRARRRGRLGDQPAAAARGSAGIGRAPALAGLDAGAGREDGLCGCGMADPSPPRACRGAAAQLPLRATKVQGASDPMMSTDHAGQSARHRRHRQGRDPHSLRDGEGAAGLDAARQRRRRRLLGLPVIFDVDHEKAPGDLVIERDGATVLIDETSLDLLEGCTIDFVDDLSASPSGSPTRTRPAPAAAGRRSRSRASIARAIDRPIRHGRACPDHPRLRWSRLCSRAWTLGTRPSMTAQGNRTLDATKRRSVRAGAPPCSSRISAAIRPFGPGP